MTKRDRGAAAGTAGNPARREPPLKWLAKVVFHWICLNAGPAGLRNSWLRLRRRTRCTILLYHRVNDVARDNLTTSLTRFTEHLVTVKRHYPVLSLTAAVAALREGQYLGPNVVVITFDDGYADNHDCAAPVLERFGLPATFFLTVGLVGSSQAFEHDHGSPHRFANLTWEQVRDLAARGFEIGSHALTHRNLAQCSLDEARREIMESREILERMLGRPVHCFAYPFGGRHDVTPEVLREICDAGFDVVASAYGGVNAGRLDPLNVLRTGVSEAFDTLALRAKVEGVSFQDIGQRLADRRAARRAASANPPARQPMVERRERHHSA